MSGDLKVVVAAPRGYCAGVDRAVETVEKALELYGTPVYVRKQIVHNRHVVERLAGKGAIFVNSLDEVPIGSTVIFAAHGVSPAVREHAAERQLNTIDATCPFVSKVHQEAKRYAAKGVNIIYIGHAGHDEVIGTCGEAPDNITLVQSPEEAKTVEVPDPENVAWLSQTTLCVDETMETVAHLRKKFPMMISPPSDDICYATQNRQSAVKHTAAGVDLFIVVGSRNSSNSTRLVEVASTAGAKVVKQVDDATEIDPAWFDGVKSVGVSSGASVPDILVQGVLRFLEDYGFPKAVEDELFEEDMTFSLPPEIRRVRK